MKRPDMLARSSFVTAHLTLAVLAGILVTGMSGPANADLTICNQTKQSTGVALAMKSKSAWKSEGWWTVEPGRCKTLLKGRLAKRDYFIHALHYKVGGRWEGEKGFCIDRGSFSIEGRMDCEARGYQTAGFLKINTEGKLDWQHTLTDRPDTSSPREEKE